jgi:hypothetical protein
MSGKHTNEFDADPSADEIAADARRRRENEYLDALSWLRGAWAGDYPAVETAAKHTLFSEAMLDSANEVEAYVNGLKKDYAAVLEAAKRAETILGTFRGLGGYWEHPDEESLLRLRNALAALEQP